MPRLSCWFVRLALAYLAIGFTLGALMLANKGIPFAPMIWSLLPAHMEILMVGWLLQLALGVAFWILPRLAGSSRGNENLVWLALVLINLGIVLVILATYVSQPALTIAGRLAEVGGVLAFALGSWRRIKPFAV
jgi:hypothetical protein